MHIAFGTNRLNEMLAQLRKMVRNVCFIWNNKFTVSATVLLEEIKSIVQWACCNAKAGVDYACFEAPGWDTLQQTR